VDGNNANSGGVPQTGLGTVGAIGGLTNLGYFSRTTVHYWTGSIDELSIWNYAKWTSTFTPPSGPYTGSEAGLVSLYHLDGYLGDSYATATSIQKVPVSATALANNQSLVYQSGSSAYVPTTLYTLANGLGTSATGNTSLQVNVSMNVRAGNVPSDTLMPGDCGGLVGYAPQ